MVFGPIYCAFNHSIYWIWWWLFKINLICITNMMIVRMTHRLDGRCWHTPRWQTGHRVTTCPPPPRPRSRPWPGRWAGRPPQAGAGRGCCTCCGRPSVDWCGSWSRSLGHCYDGTGSESGKIPDCWTDGTCGSWRGWISPSFDHFWACWDVRRRMSDCLRILARTCWICFLFLTEQSRRGWSPSCPARRTSSSCRAPPTTRNLAGCSYVLFAEEHQDECLRRSWEDSWWPRRNIFVKEECLRDYCSYTTRWRHIQSLTGSLDVKKLENICWHVAKSRCLRRCRPQILGEWRRSGGRSSGSPGWVSGSRNCRRYRRRSLASPPGFLWLPVFFSWKNQAFVFKFCKFEITSRQKIVKSKFKICFPWVEGNLFLSNVLHIWNEWENLHMSWC